MNGVLWLWIGLSLLAALVFAALIWLGGPLISIGDEQPFDGVFIRVLLIALVFAIVGGIIAWRVIARRRAAAALEKAMVQPAVEDSDAPVLQERMQDALATLKRSAGGSASALYDLPWYLIIGPPGAGKTTALVNSGLKFPLAGGARAVQGVGGTRYCDWWFTDQAVLIDTAGRYTTQDSDAKVDRRSWLSFLELLKTNRPRQPINGVIVAISVADVLGLSPAELATHADAIRKRLSELHEELKVDFPVYAMFTKMDLVTGFTPYFADLDENRRKAVWGATFQTADKRANRVGDVPAEMDLLIQRLTEGMADRLQFEPDLRARALLFGLPAQLGAIRKPMTDFLNRIFEPSRFQSSTTLRGFYFTSGTQEGTPFDAVVGALQRSFGVDNTSAASFAGPGKSYFLHDFLTKLVFAEAGWVSTNVAAVRRNLVARATSFALLTLVTLGVLALWWGSYTRNTQLIAETRAGVEGYAAAAAPLIQQASVSDPDVRPVYELIDALPNLPAGYAHRKESSPLAATYGLDQRPRVQDASLTIYQNALERLMRPRLILSLEQQIQKNIGDPTYVYEALKVYLMLGGKAPNVDKELVVNWFTRDWEERLFPGAPYAAGRALLRDHLAAMLDLDQGAPTRISLNGPLVEQAQATLARMRVAERAYTLLKAASHNEPIEDWNASQRGGPDMALVFETVNGANLDTVHTPAFFTYDGFYTGLIDRITTIADALQKENWVLGPSGDQGAVKQQYASLFPDLLDLYGRDFIAAWDAALGNLQLRPLLADKPKYLALSAASAPTSPIRQIFESVRDETSLTRERKTRPTADPAAQALEKAAINRLNTPGRAAIDLALKSQRRAGDPPPEAPGANIEANFKPFQILTDGEPGSRPIDALLANLNELYRQLTLAATNPTQSKQALDQAQVQVASLRSNVTRLPQPLAGMMQKVANDADGVAVASSIAQLSDSMAQEVTSACQQIVSNRYPFSPKSDRDTPLADFSRLFAPNGILDRFFAANLAPLVNLTSKTWAWRPNITPSRKLSDATLKQFQSAAEIRDAFFPTGGVTPNLSLEVKMTTLNGNAQSATLTVNGTAIQSQTGASVASTLQWPGAGAAGASIQLAPDVPDQKSTIERTGAWALFRLIDAGVVTPRGDTINVGFVVGGRDVSYQFRAASLNNPLTLPALRQFKCPNGL